MSTTQPRPTCGRIKSLPRICYADVILCARAMMTVSPRWRRIFIQNLLSDTLCVTRYCQEKGTNHPFYGDGTLASVALSRNPVPEPPIKDSEFRECLIIALDEIGEFQQRLASINAKETTND